MKYPEQPGPPSNATWIRFDELTPNPGTKRWAVMPKDGSAQIGQVKWYGPWRKYCFMPMANCVFEQVCLREISDFCENQTERWWSSFLGAPEQGGFNFECGGVESRHAALGASDYSNPQASQANTYGNAEPSLINDGTGAVRQNTPRPTGESKKPDSRSSDRPAFIL